jgi:hypothetical protein
LSEAEKEESRQAQTPQVETQQQLAKGIKQLAENYLPRLQKYEEQEAILGSATATRKRMKTPPSCA